MLMSALLGWAIVATAVAIYALARQAHWRRSYLASLRLIPAMHLAPPPAKSPHQRGAETARARRLERMRAHRMALQASMTEARP